MTITTSNNNNMKASIPDHQDYSDEGNTMTMMIPEDHVPLATAVLIDEGVTATTTAAEVDVALVGGQQQQQHYQHQDPFHDEPPSTSLSGHDNLNVNHHHASDIEEQGGASSCASSPHHQNPNTTETTASSRPRMLHHLGRTSKLLTCPLCEEQTQSIVQVGQPGGFALVMAIFVFCVAWPFFWIPLVVPSCRPCQHFCDKCHGQIGQTDPCG